MYETYGGTMKYNRTKNNLSTTRYIVRTRSIVVNLGSAFKIIKLLQITLTINNWMNAQKITSLVKVQKIKVICDSVVKNYVKNSNCCIDTE